jgi:aryl-alcohol dehydrogenase
VQLQAAVLRRAGAPLSIETLEIDGPRPGEIAVRLVASGICHTDLHACEESSSVPRPVVLGHEGAGIVERVGAQVTKVVPGDAVLMTFDSCGGCPCCLRNAPAYCHRLLERNFGGRRPDGTAPFVDRSGAPVFGNFFGQSSFATHAICRERNVVKCDAALPLDVLAPLGCAIQTGAGAVLRSLRVAAGESIAVFGAGSVGLSAIMAAALVGARPIIAVDVAEARLAAARTAGASHAIDSTVADARAAILDISGAGVQHAIDTSGQARVVETAIACLAPLGTCGVVAATAEPVRFHARHLLSGGRTIRGIVEGDSVPDEFIPQLIEHFRGGRLPFDRLLTHYPFSRINEAIEDARSGRVIKPVLRFA